MSKSIDAILANFDINLNVNNAKCERFDVVDVANEINEFFVCFENVTNLKIEIFEIVLSEIDEIVIVEIVIVILFLFLLKRNFVALIISFVDLT